VNILIRRNNVNKKNNKIKNIIKNKNQTKPEKFSSSLISFIVPKSGMSTQTNKTVITTNHGFLFFSIHSHITTENITIYES
jgi:hypothetical protein